MLDNKVRQLLFIIFLFILALVPRVFLLDVVPFSMIHDELNYILNAKSQFYTGKNIPWTASALFSWGEKNFDIVIAEIPSILISGWVGSNNLSQFNARLPYSIISSFAVVLIYLITKKVLNEKIAKIAGIFMAVNPWSIHFGRTALETSFATFFFLFGIFVLLKTNSWKILLALPLFLGGFLSYLGAKLLFLPIIIICLSLKFYAKGKPSKNIQPYLVFAAIAFITVLLYYVTLDFQPAGDRKIELLFFKTDWVKGIVDGERQQAIPNPLLEIFSNKATVILRRIADFYVAAFSTTSLFGKGETISVYSIWQYGQFHYIDLPLILMGLVWLFTLKRSIFWFVTAIIAISPFVSAINLVEQTYAVRTFPMFPFLIILSATGFWYILEKTRFGKIFAFCIALVYIISVGYFLHLYFFRYPVYAAERWFFNERLISNYARLAQDHPEINKIYVVTREGAKWVFEEYLFYSGIYNKEADVKSINEKLIIRDFSYGKVIFLNECPDVKLGGEDILIANINSKCNSEEVGGHGFVDLKDAGTVVVITNDILCKNIQNLPRYYRITDINIFRIEKLTVEEFCKNWVVEF